MDHHDLKACRMIKDVRHRSSPGQQDLLGKANSLSNCCESFSEGNTGSEKQEHDFNEINSRKAAKKPEMERECLNYDHISSIDCNKEKMDDVRPVSSVVSTSRNSAVMKENCAEGTSRVMSHGNKNSGDGNSKDGDVSVNSPKGIDSTRNISIKSDVSLETREPLNKENNELLDRKMNGYWLNAGEDGLKSMMQVTYHDRQLKTESSSSNSTQVILPASSNDSCQETSVDAKSSKHSKTSGTYGSTCTDFKCSLEEPAVKSLVSGMVTQIASKDEPDKNGFLPGKQGNLGKASEIVDNVRARDCDKVPGMIAERNSMAAKMSERLKSNLPKNKNAQLPNWGVVEPFCEHDDALEVARRVAREVEQEVVSCRETPGCFSSVERRNDETVHLSYVDSAVPNKRDGLTETGCRIFPCIEQKCDSFYSSKEVVDSEMSMRKERLCLKVEESSQDMGPTMMHEVRNDFRRQELSYLTTKREGVVLNDLTAHHSGIDLNEDILVNEVEEYKQSVKEIASCHAENVSKPIRVVAKSGISALFPMPQLQFEGEVGGWRGSAATSAFRPTSLSEGSSRNKASSVDNNNNGSKCSQVKGIDLNVAAAGVDFDTELLPVKCVPSEESSVEVSSTRSEMLNIDLNCVSENDDNCCQPFPPASLSRHSVRDFDLNDNPMSIDACSDAHRPGQSTHELRKRPVDDPAVSFIGNARQIDSNSMGSAYWADMSPMLGFSHGHAKPFLVAAPNMLPPMEQMRRIVSLQHKSAYTPISPPPPPPPNAVPYNSGFCMDPNNRLSSTVYSQGAIPYMTDQRGTTVFPQILGSGTPPSFSGASHLMQVPGGPGLSDISIIRPSLNPNGGVTSSESGSRGGNGRQLFIPVSNSTMEEQMRSFQQVALPATPMKRREPEGGWESQHLSYRNVTSWR